jgi:hypothetical protein
MVDVDFPENTGPMRVTCSAEFKTPSLGLPEFCDVSLAPEKGTFIMEFLCE